MRVMGLPNLSWLSTLPDTLKKLQREHSETPQISGSFFPSHQSGSSLGTSRGGGQPGNAQVLQGSESEPSRAACMSLGCQGLICSPAFPWGTDSSQEVGSFPSTARAMSWGLTPTTQQLLERLSPAGGAGSSVGLCRVSCAPGGSANLLSS